MVMPEELPYVLSFLAGVGVVFLPLALLAAYIVWKRLARKDG